MKKFIANIIRITITYSKFLLMVIVLSSSGTLVKADDAYTYLKCGSLKTQVLSNGHILLTKNKVGVIKAHSQALVINLLKRW